MRFLNLILLGCLLGLLRDYENTFTQGFTNVDIKYKGRIERSTSLGRIGFTQNYLALDVDVGGKNEHNIPEFNILGNIGFDIIGSSQEHSELNLFTKPAWADINESPGSNNIDSSKQLGNNVSNIDKDDSSWRSNCGLTSRAWVDIVQENEHFDSLHDPKHASLNNQNNDTLDRPISLTDFLSEPQHLCKKHRKEIRKQYLKYSKNRGYHQSLTVLLNQQEKNLIKEAMAVAYVALWGKTTLRSLEVMINRAVGVASVLEELQQSLEVILAGILHEVVADLIANNDINTVGQLVEKFGAHVITLSDQYQRLPKFMARKTDYTPLQSESQVQFLVLMAEDYRVLFIRLADRLHTMRILRSLPLDEMERNKISQEGLNVYAPLAHKMGLLKVRGELEDLSFRWLSPHMFELCRYTQASAFKAYQDAAENVQQILMFDPLLVSLNTTFKLSYRVKDKYQLYLKMKRKNLNSINDVRDALGLRIIVETPRQPWDSDHDVIKRGNDICYYLIERLRNMDGWEPSVQGFKDYIIGVKQNGYQSLHQYIRHLALDTNVEVQVRTSAMHMAAELGEAAHWSYKDQLYRPEVANAKYYKIAWRSKAQLEAKSPEEMIQMARVQLRNSRVFVYLEDLSTVLNLKRGATTLDAAFHIHTDVGLSTTGIRVDGKPRSFGTVLRMGDVISVDCAPDKRAVAKPSWLSMLATTQSQATLRKYFRDNHTGTLVCLGLVQLMLLLSDNRERLESKYNELPDAYRLVRICQARVGVGLGEFLSRLGAVSSREDSSQYYKRLLDIPISELQIPTVTMALMWGRVEDNQAGPKLSDLQPDIKELSMNILAQVLREILPEQGLNYQQIWTELVGPNLLALTEPVPEPPKVFFPMPERPIVQTRPLKSRYLENQAEDHDSADTNKTFIYRDAKGGLRDIYSHAPISLYRETPTLSNMPSSSPSPSPKLSLQDSIHASSPPNFFTTQPYPSGPSYQAQSPSTLPPFIKACAPRGPLSYFDLLQKTSRTRSHKSPYLYAKKPYALQAVQLSSTNRPLHRLAKARYASQILGHMGKE